MDNEPIDDVAQQAKRKLDDSDKSRDAVTAAVKRPKGEARFDLLDFSDDVLLNVLKYCSPRDLKALSFCCRRLARLCMDRSLWRNIDLRKQAVGVGSLSFYTKCIQPTTTALCIRGLIGAGAIKRDSFHRNVPKMCECSKRIEAKLAKKSQRRDPETRPRPDSSAADPTPPAVRREADAPSTSGGVPVVKVHPCVGNASPKPFYGTPPSSPEPGSPSSVAKRDGGPSSAVDPAPEHSKRPVSNSSPKPYSRSEAAKPGTSRADGGSEDGFPYLQCDSMKVPVENGNTSPKPYFASYENYPSLSQINTESGAGVKKERRIISSAPIADCCLFSNFCQASINNDILNYIKNTCYNLLDLRLEYCNLNCYPFPISDLPKTLKILSLKGSKRTFLPFQKPFLFKIQDYLPDLEEIDFSYCPWVTGHSLLLLSKVKSLRKLLLCYCSGLGECVAYASLSTRFGFKALEILDIRGTSMGDSEVSSFGSIVGLKELYLEPPQSNSSAFPNSWPSHSGLMESWESQNPCKEVEEYIDMMNKNTPKDPSQDNDGTSGKNRNKPEDATKRDGRKSSGANDDDNLEGEENVGVFYRSIVNVSYNGRAQPNENDNRPPDRHENPPAPDALPNNGRPVNVQIGALDMQMGPVGVQVGPLRLQVRHPPRPEAEAEPRNVEVQVGLGGIRVDRQWLPNNQEENVQVDPVWIQNEEVQLDHVEVQVAAERVQDAPDHGMGMQMGPIEVQVGDVSIELDANRRHNGGENRPDGGHENIIINYDVPRRHRNPNGGEDIRMELLNGDRPGPDPPRRNVPRFPFGELHHEEARNVDDFRVRYDYNERNENPRIIGNNRQPVGFHVHVSPLLGRNQNQGDIDDQVVQDERPILQDERPILQVDPPIDGQQNNQPEHHRRGPVEWLQLGHEVLQVGIRSYNPGRPLPPAEGLENIGIDAPMRREEYLFPVDEQIRHPVPNPIGPHRAERRSFMDGRVHVIYVDPGYGRRLAHAYRHNEEAAQAMVGRQEFPLHNLNRLIDMPIIQLPLWNEGSLLRRLYGAELVTDASLLRLGDSEQLVHVGGPQVRRRRTSRLEVLVCRGYRLVTDRSLSHLAVAAPSLRFLDVENCGVTLQGVSAFANVRPDCLITYNCDEPLDAGER